MIDLQQTTNALLSFLTTPNKDWSFCTLSFMVAFLVFFAAAHNNIAFVVPDQEDDAATAWKATQNRAFARYPD